MLFGDQAHRNPDNAPRHERDGQEALFRKGCDSQTFQKAPAMRALLAYLWEHRAGAISEYAVAVEALGRRPEFDPKLDATVRVQIARLRRKLHEYYESEDPGAPVRLSIPLGGHHLEMMRAGPGIGLPWSHQGMRTTVAGESGAVRPASILGSLRRTVSQPAWCFPPPSFFSGKTCGWSCAIRV